MRTHTWLQPVASALAATGLLIAAGAARAAEPTFSELGGEISAPTMFAIQRNYGPIEERTERIPAQLLTGGLAPPFVPVGWGFRYGFARPWYGFYYGPRYNYGYGGPYFSHYHPYAGFGYGPYYGYRGYYGYGPYSVYRPYYGGFYNRPPVYGNLGGCYYW